MNLATFRVAIFPSGSYANSDGSACEFAGEKGRENEGMGVNSGVTESQIYTLRALYFNSFNDSVKLL